jgi:hypothetical protein
MPCLFSPHHEALIHNAALCLRSHLIEEINTFIRYQFSKRSLSTNDHFFKSLRMNSKIYSILAIFLLLPMIMHSQKFSKLYVEVGIIENSAVDPYYNMDLNNTKFTYFNRIGVGLESALGHRYFSRVKRISYNNLRSTAYTGWNIQGKGFELELGRLFQIFKYKRLSLHLGPELFWEMVINTGSGYTDVVPPGNFEIAHRRHYIGVAGIAKADFRINKLLSVTYESRGRTGSVYYSNADYYENYRQSWFSDYQWVGMVGLKYTIPKS